MGWNRGSYIHYCLENKNSGDLFKTTEIFTQKEKEKALDIVNKFRDSDLGKSYVLKEGKHEISFGLKKQNNTLKDCKYFNINAIFKGKIDYLFEHKKELFLIDWKSGRYVENQNYNQLRLYSIWAFLNYKKIQKVNCSFVYIEQDKENLITFTRDELIQSIEILYKMINNIENDKVFIKNETAHCQYCDYRKFHYCKSVENHNGEKK